MPLGYKDAGSIAAEIRMTRTLHPGAFLVVEGPCDIRFWLTRRHSTCEVVDGEGKTNVLGSIQHLNAEEFDGVMAVVDDDYDSVMGIELRTENVIVTETHDLECLLCQSGALDAVLAEFGVAKKVRRFEKESGREVREGLLERALVFGRLRWAVMRQRKTIDRNTIRVRRFVNPETWTVDEAGMIGGLWLAGSAAFVKVLTVVQFWELWHNRWRGDREPECGWESD